MGYKTKDELTEKISVFNTKNGTEYKIWLTYTTGRSGNRHIHLACTNTDGSENGKIVGTFKDSADGEYEFVLGMEPAK